MEKIRNSKHFVTFVCLILGAVLLTSAAVANIGNAGGYEAYKDGLLGLLTLEDYSGNIDFTVTVDGTELVYLNYFEEVNTNAKPGEVHTHVGYNGQVNLRDIEEDFGVEQEESWSVVNPLDHPSGRDYTNYGYNTYTDPIQWNINSRNYTDGVLSDFRVDAEDEYSQKIIDIIEMGVDLVVGDLKNNFVYIGEEDGIAKYRVSLSGDQLPEIVQALISLLTEDSLYMSDYGIQVAVGFEPYSDLSDEELEEYRNLRDEVLWSRMYEDETSKYFQKGYFVIFPDLSYEYYEDIDDYYRTVDEVPLEQLLDSMDIAFLMMEKEPEITVASCELSIDENGNLVANTLEGTVEIELVNGQKHSITLRVDATLDPLNGRKIDMPVIPADATVYDYSQGNRENGYIYTITKNGITTTHSETEEQQQQALTRFYQMHGFERINEAAGWTGSWFDIYGEYPVDLYGDGTTVQCYEIDLASSEDVTYEVDGETPEDIVYGPVVEAVPVVTEPVVDMNPESFDSSIEGIIGGADGETEVIIVEQKAVPMTEPVVDYEYYGYSDSGKVFIPVEQFESACATMFSAGEGMKDFAENMGLTAPEVVKVLLADYEQITGRAFEGYVFWMNN